MKLKIYSRTEYLKWCEANGVKTILPESKRNKLTISGYPIHDIRLYDEDRD